MAWASQRSCSVDGNRTVNRKNKTEAKRRAEKPESHSNASNAPTTTVPGFAEMLSNLGKRPSGFGEGFLADDVISA
jgi:hypothetical protein